MNTAYGKGVNPLWVRVAAADSLPAAKAAADFVCAGKHDEETLQRAICLCEDTGRNLLLYSGVYMIDAFREWDDGGPCAALRLPPRRHFAISGQDWFQAGAGMTPSPKNGVTWYVRCGAWETTGEGVPSVLRGSWTPKGVQNGSGLRFENISVFICDAQHPARCIDLRRTDGAEVRNVRLRGMGERCMVGDSFPYEKFGPLPAPCPDAIGITMTSGSNLPVSRFDNIHATGFGQAFQAGGEHVVCCDCLASFNLYGWTFGNYAYTSGFNHPIVLVNCGDEQSVHLPLFADCGDDGGAIRGMQSVTMVGFNFERIPGKVIGGRLGNLMRETHPGTWRGHIEYTYQPAWHATNSVGDPVWEPDGSGCGFETRNLAHRLAGPAAERLSYAPHFGQQFFDTDLGRLLVCTDPAKRLWVDALGRPADNGAPSTKPCGEKRR